MLAIALVMVFTHRATLMPALPAYPLAYLESDGTFYQIDFATSERTMPAPDEVTWPERYKVVSPDGQWMAQWKWVAEYYERELWLTPTGITGTPRLYGTFYAADDPLSWSPDSQWMTFASYPQDVDWDSAGPHAVEIWKLHVETGDIVRLSDNDYMDSDPFFSPDGTQIAYMSAADGYPRVFVMDVATGKSQLTTPTYYGDNPKWSPDGEWIAFETMWYDATEGATYPNVVIVRADGTLEQPVAFGPASRTSLVGWQTP